MSKQPSDLPSKPTLTPRAAAALAERKAREAAALRENLHKRKAQSAARRAPPPEEPSTS